MSFVIPEKTNGFWVNGINIEDHYRLALKFCGPYLQKCRPCDCDDIIQSSIIGLIRAAEKYNPSMGAFSTFAVWYIKAEVYQVLAGINHLIKIPQNVYLDYIRWAKDDYPAVSGNRFRTFRSVKNAISPMYNIDEMLWDEPSCDPIPNVDDVIIANNILNTAKEILTDKEFDVLCKRYGFYDGEPWTLEEIGDSLGVTRERIRQIEQKALRKIKFKVKKDLG